MSPTELSKSAHKRLQAELVDLTTRGRIEVANRIEDARSLGDLSENGDYHAAKDDQGKMEARVRQLQATLEDAIIIDDLPGGSVVATGSLVSLRYEGDKDVERFLIGSIEERPDGAGVVSPSSPLGQALIGHAAGETVEYEAPNGALRVEIVSIG